MTDTLTAALAIFPEPMGGIVHKLILCMLRIGMCMAWLPALDKGAIASRRTRMALAVVVAGGLWQLVGSPPPWQQHFSLVASLACEAFAGLMLGLMLALPFHIFHAIGAMFDNQRGATISSAIDPFNGIDSSETSSLLHMLSAVVFLQTGGMTHVLDAIVASYQLVPIGGQAWPTLEAATTTMSSILASALVMAAPVLLLLLLTEVYLGILSRFAQQMNAFAVSLAVKSFVAFAGLLLYLGSLLGERLPELFEADPLHLMAPASP